MPMNLKWGDLEATIQGSITLTPGIDPDIFNIQIGSEQRIPVNADLTFGDGENTITLKDCRGLMAGLTHNPNNKTDTFSAKDYRWRWRQSEPINGEFNRRDERNNIVGERKTAKELAEICFNNLKLPDGASFDVSAMSTTDYPFVNWEFADPAIEVHKLSQQFSILICPQTNGNIKLFKIGSSPNDEVPNLDLISTQKKEEVLSIPKNFIFVGSRNIHQVDQAEAIPLEAVGFDPFEGIYKPLVDLPYRPADGYYTNFQDDLINEFEKKAAKETVFKAYRLPESITLQQPEGQNQFPEITYQREEASRRWEENILEEEIFEFEVRRKRSFVIGKHQTKKIFNDWLAVPTDEDAVVPIPFEFDFRRGLIVFSDPVLLLDIENGGFVGADLKLVGAFRGDVFAAQFIKASGEDDLFDTVRIKGVSLQVIGSIVLNFEETDIAAKKHVDAWASQYEKGIIDSQTIVIPGIVDLSPDGWQEQISWGLNIRGGPTTTASFGTKHDLNVPDRKVRDKEIETTEIVKKQREEINNDLDDQSVIDLL